MKTRKPWLNYHKAGAPVREFHEPRKKPRELFWARFWIIVGGHVGAHQIYLKNWKIAVVWFFGAMLYLFISAIFMDTYSDGSTFKLLDIVPLLVWFAFITFKYQKLPELVKLANESIIDRKHLLDYQLRGEIGPYKSMKLIVCIIGVLYICAIIFDFFWPGSLYLSLFAILLFVCWIIAIIQYSRLKKGLTKEFQHDRP